MSKPLSYLSSFNAGQLSPLLNSKSDMELYRNGCATLRNFYVLPQGGAERRQGTQYLLEASSPNSILKSFVFTRDTSYMLDISEVSIRVLDGAGGVLATFDTPYDVSDLLDIKTEQVKDVMWLVCPNKAPQNLNRTSINPPTFTFNEVPFECPPFLDEDITGTSEVCFRPPAWEEDQQYSLGDQVHVLATQTAYSAKTDLPASPTFNVADWDTIGVDEIHLNAGTDITLVFGETLVNPTLYEGGYVKVRQERGDDKKILDTHLHQPGEDYPIRLYSEVVEISDKRTFYSMSAWRDKPSWGTFRDNPQAVLLLEVKWTPADPWVLVKRITHGNSYDGELTGTGLTQLRYVLYNGYGHGCGGSIDGVGTVSVEGSRSTKYDATTSGPSPALDVSYSDWKVETDGTWNGSAELQRSVNNGAWRTFMTLLDTRGGTAGNTSVSSITREAGATRIRVRYTHESGTFKTTLTNMTSLSTAIVKITHVNDSKYVQVNIISAPEHAHWTPLWSHSAFSQANGFPTAVKLFENRLIYSGTLEEPSTNYMSQTGNPGSFLLGDRPTDAIKVTPNTNEPTTWLLQKAGVLYQGTRGSIVTLKSLDGGLLTPTNITALEQLANGGSLIQGITSNEAVIYLERLNTKLREVIFSEQEQSMVSRDLTIMSSHIANNGFTQLCLQQTPDQIIYGVRDDGLVAGLTYERSQDIFGWSVFNFGGAVRAITPRSTATHDELWLVVQRDNGTFIEKTGSRVFSDDMLDAWYVDSGIKQVLAAQMTSHNVGICSAYFRVHSNGHGLVDDDYIRIDSAEVYDYVVDKVFRVKIHDVNQFDLYPEDGSGVAIDPTQFPSYTDPASTVEQVSFTPVRKTWEGLDHLNGSDVQVMGDGGFSGTYPVVNGSFTADEYYNQTIAGLRYLSILQPMFIESGQYQSNGTQKVCLDAVIRFYRTIGGFSGMLIQGGDNDPEFDFEQLEELFPNMPWDTYDMEPINSRSYVDPLAKVVTPANCTELVKYNDSYSRVKSVFVIQDNPLPMTVQSIGVKLGVGG